ncbi:MAG TPA: UDP-N-acetylglucosamine 2-epimerase (non-hydrolyzing) [Pirellulales bacterium]|nr:UDP-N-acetylglucosamine 2-epimerase (non-hydrolyzing) [Pirellulales bacterium]
MARLRVLLTIGTRPEAIKMAPVVLECRRADAIEPIVCFASQHREMLTQVTDYFGIEADTDLDLMTAGQTLAGFMARCLTGLDDLLDKCRPDVMIAQGDTTTVIAAALAAFYRRVMFVHVEAGLRTGNLQAPWPEELNRRVATLAATLHCAPTRRAADNLLAEGVRAEQIVLTGNTVVDALLATVERERANGEARRAAHSMLGDRRLVLITGHRRESFGQGLERICQAIGRLADDFPDVMFLYPVHLNPQVWENVHARLSGRRNVQLRPPAPYPEFVWLMDRSTLILTDSGGVQEEAPSLGKPVVVMRETTERPEAVEAGVAELVGTSVEAIVSAVGKLLSDGEEYARRQSRTNPYGDGRAAQRIVEAIVNRFASSLPKG